MVKVERIDTENSFITIFKIQIDDEGNSHQEIPCPSGKPADDYELELKLKYDSIKKQKGRKNVVN